MPSVREVRLDTTWTKAAVHELYPRPGGTTADTGARPEMMGATARLSAEGERQFAVMARIVACGFTLTAHTWKGLGPTA